MSALFNRKKNDLYLKCLQRRDKCMYACIPVAMMKEKKRMCKPEKLAIFILKFFFFFFAKIYSQVSI